MRNQIGFKSTLAIDWIVSLHPLPPLHYRVVDFIHDFDRNVVISVVADYPIDL